MKSPFASLLTVLLLCAFCHPASSEDLLKPGDRIAFIGNTFVERARLYGHIESALYLAAGKGAGDMRIRNLGWSADSVFGDSRSYFGPPSEGRERLATNLREIQPHVVLLCYGTGEAMSVEQGWTDEKDAAAASAAGLERSLALFVGAYQQLIEEVRTAAGDSLRELVLLSPPPLENLAPPLPDQSRNNANLAQFRDAIRELAETNQARFVDLFAALGGDDFDGGLASPPLTENGVHYTEEGYRVAARELIKGLGYEETPVTTLSPDATEELSEAIREKNRLFFHRWRPANETYLFLFRKHEQGQNAKEIPLFDPLIEAQETRIFEARDRILSGITKN